MPRVQFVSADASFPGFSGDAVMSCAAARGRKKKKLWTVAGPCLNVPTRIKTMIQFEDGNDGQECCSVNIRADQVYNLFTKYSLKKINFSENSSHNDFVIVLYIPPLVKFMTAE